MENAKEYITTKEGPKEEVNNQMHRLIEAEWEKHEDPKLLEVGFGSGEMLDRYPRGSSWGIDWNKEMVEHAQNAKRNVFREDICNPTFVFMQKYEHFFDFIVANYVFSEMKTEDLEKAFKNCHTLLKDTGKLYFSLTNPRMRHRTDLPGYKIIFSQTYEYEKKDLSFKVLLWDGKKYADVGILDYHNPVETYIDIIEKKFTLEHLYEISGSVGFAHALVFQVEKLE
ncbi:class I SAM-dependent methyltransferase [Candidatus Woesearchaeota archaeon]|nr:class I SAM-dependent methyltransferase [Nanoarchaeota archaeon]MCB9371142.1 class I SAM-dependent methyltransferase [Candidatus Woesearchaeota archaeon]USN43863.1 MAG: class I SAM-dependent methyltransferase [Candidatus Woesearchaeota archaeon]